ncbi:putative membrane protein YphA (DoxX/SURF4 family) [Paractinoplanes brasiliensis]|uniref:Putative membrane protein YphA (DoxX/SURF4 family) n=1 Tax=Paractinoplanes brasiliensis TaxID=52695 RepID=A0A4R6JQY7_9ACTN|nr:MauE/DoxX family redox-associated membrane protein [Actinoplanes brasiliensis]TDO38417.1 putative membrane protein YphA (DoxX/SURF4 family) [Actinoplanes brasiliensis]
MQRPSRLAAAWPWISTLARLGLAAVFLIAGGLKVTDLAASARAVNAYDLMSYDTAKVIGAIQPFLEIALGLLLLIGIATRLSAAIAAVLMVIFIAGIVSAWARGLQIDCGCFSKGGELTGGRTTQYGLDILRDVGFLALAGLLMWKPRSKFSVDGLLMGDR